MPECVLVERDSVLVNCSSNPHLPGVIYSKTGLASFTIDLTDGRRVRRHVDQSRKNSDVDGSSNE